MSRGRRRYFATSTKCAVSSQYGKPARVSGTAHNSTCSELAKISVLLYSSIMQIIQMIRLLLIGIVVGMCNVIPGVSGGTMVVVFNIYEQFVNAITLNIKKLIKNWKFVVPVLGGMAAGVLIFSKLITVLYGKFPVQTNYFFFGLILGSIPFLFKLTTKHEPGKHLSAKRIISIVICAAAGFVFLLWFSSLEKSVDRTAVIMVLPEIKPMLLVRIFFAGILGAVAMIIPGISGSLLMLIMGVYPIVIASIPALFSSETFFHALFLLLPNGVGVIIGLLGGAKLVSWIMKVAEAQAYSVILGLILASAVTIFPGFSSINGVLQGIACVVCTAIGAAMAFFSTKFAPQEK